MDTGYNSINTQNIKYKKERLSKNISEILQVNNPIQTLKVIRSNQLNKINEDNTSRILNQNEKNYENLEIKKYNKHKLYKSIDDQKNSIY